MAHLSNSQRLAAGFHPPPSLVRPFAAVQAAWRFYSNNRVTLPELSAPLIECARADLDATCEDWLLVAFDWCNIHFCSHEHRKDRVPLAHTKDLGYELLTALAVGDREGCPVAPLCLDLRASDGVHSTRSDSPLTPVSSLDALEPLMAYVHGLNMGKPAAFIIDREGDSVGHYRHWAAAGRKFLVRANDRPRVMYEGQHRPLSQVADVLRKRGAFRAARPVLLKGKPAEQFVAETAVVLTRPARMQRVDPKTGKAKHKDISGPPLPLRLVVSEVRNPRGKVLARWLLLSNLPASVKCETLALWYYWRWQIESYHKLLKGAGQHVESWLQETAVTLSRRLAVAPMACLVVWRLARDDSLPALEMREVLVRLSGRQMKRGKKTRSFTEPALLAGLSVLIPMLDYLRDHDLNHLRRLADAALPGLVYPGATLEDG
ncbi:MAG: hypothetical protein JSU86_14395 [Phycisphaerales bacterium]|nr:MAG: hypothetical protein JSU86_14395 [Phycisphaerales bacterium]